MIREYAETFKALSDETRIRTLYLFLKADSELCVCELTDSLEVTQYNVSRHLKILRNAGLIEGYKEGRWVYFHINKKRNAFKSAVLKSVSSIADEQIRKDERELRKRMQMRTNGKCVIGVQKKHLINKD